MLGGKGGSRAPGGIRDEDVGQRDAPQDTSHPTCTPEPTCASDGVLTPHCAGRLVSRAGSVRTPGRVPRTFLECGVYRFFSF